jgi:hypothetical protein
MMKPAKSSNVRRFLQGAATVLTVSLALTLRIEHACSDRPENDLFTPSDAPHGPITIAGGLGSASGSVTLSGGTGSGVTAGGVGSPKPAVGVGGFLNFSWGGKGTSTFSLPKVYKTLKAASQPLPTGNSFTCAKSGVNCGR